MKEPSHGIDPAEANETPTKRLRALRAEQADEILGEKPPLPEEKSGKIAYPPQDR